MCVCESCWALRSGDSEFRPTGTPDAVARGLPAAGGIWAQFRIPIGLAFFMHSSVTDCVVALYPSPAGATECELHFETWNRLARDEPGARRPRARRRGADREPDGGPAEFAIVPIDRCYMLVGLVKATWEGISGGQGVEQAIEGFFDELRRCADRADRRREPVRAAAVPVAPEPEFRVLGASGRRHAAAPALDSTST